MREKRSLWIRIGLTALCLCLAACVFVLLYSYTKAEKEPLYLTPTFQDLKGWELYRLAEEEKIPLSPEELLAEGGVVYMSRTLEEELEEAGYTGLSLEGVSWQVSVFLNGELLYTVAPGYGAAPKEATFPSEYSGIRGQGEHVQISLPPGYGGKTLTLALKKASEYAGLPMVILSNLEITTANTVATAADGLVPATFFFTAAFLLLGLNIYGLFHRQWDGALLLLCLAALFQGLYQLRELGFYLAGEMALDVPAAMVIPTLFLTLPLIYLSVRLDHIGWKWRLLALIPAIGALILKICGVMILSLNNGSFYELYVGLLLLSVLAMLLCAAWDAGKNGKSGRVLWLALGGTLLFLTAACLFSNASNGSLWREVSNAFHMAAAGIWDLLLYWCGVLLFLVCAVLSVEEAIRSAVENRFQVLLLSTRISALQDRINAARAAEDAVRLESHDMRHRLLTIAGLAKKGRLQELLDFTDSAQKRLDELAPVRWCKPPVLDAVFSSYFAQAKQQKIKVQAELHLTEKLPVDEAELAIIFANVLENAIHANLSLPEEAREIRCKIISQPTLMFVFSNPCAGKVVFDRKGRPMAMDANHGLGIRSIEAFCKKYGASCSYSMEDGWFSVQIVL